MQLKVFLYLPILFFFLPAFSFWLPGLNKAYSFFFLFLYIALFIMFYTSPKRIIKRTISVVKSTPLKYFAIVLLLISVNGLMHFYMGQKFLLSSIRSTIMQIFLCVIPVLIYYINVIEDYISYKKFLKWFFFLYWIVLILGFISFVGELLNISIITIIFDFFANARILSFEQNNIIAQANSYAVNNIPRLDNLFEEPSWYARYIFIFLPLIYSIADCKNKIFKRNNLNIIVKKTIVPFSWLSLVLTFSPIFIVFGIIITLVYYRDKIIDKLKQNPLIFIFSIFVIIILGTLLKQTDCSNIPVISRIITAFSTHSMYEFVQESSSLANRIICYINTFCIFLQHPFVGMGIGNLANTMLDQFYNSPVPLTLETIGHISRANSLGKGVQYNGGYIYVFLAENGIFITLIYLYFWKNLYSKLHRLSKFLNKNDFINAMNKGLCGCISGFVILFLYDYNFANLELYIVLVLSILLLYENKKRIVVTQMENNERIE